MRDRRQASFYFSLRRWFATSLFLLLAFSGFTQEVSVSAKLDTNAMLIGDHVGLEVSYTGPVKTQVIWPFLPDTILGNIQVIGRGKIDTVFSADKKSVTLTQEFNITCYDSGFYTIPSIPFRYRNLPDTTIRLAQCDMLLLAVHTVPVDTTLAIKPIKGPLKVPVTFREMLPWILAGLAALLLIAGIIWYLKKRKKNEPVFRIKPRIRLQPHEKALQELEKLRVRLLWQNGKVKEYHSEVTGILRNYIEERFLIPALESTTAEIMEGMLGRHECPRESMDQLGHVLMLADMVKFAKAVPAPLENERSLETAIGFVNRTAEIREAVPPAGKTEELPVTDDKNLTKE
jgi:LPXTG-motif cell wall-anchored protein